MKVIAATTKIPIVFFKQVHFVAASIPLKGGTTNTVCKKSQPLCECRAVRSGFCQISSAAQEFWRTPLRTIKFNYSSSKSWFSNSLVESRLFGSVNKRSTSSENISTLALNSARLNSNSSLDRKCNSLTSSAILEISSVIDWSEGFNIMCACTDSIDSRLV